MSESTVGGKILFLNVHFGKEREEIFIFLMETFIFSDGNFHLYVF
jgi:hypothetical protein